MAEIKAIKARRSSSLSDFFLRYYLLLGLGLMVLIIAISYIFLLKPKYQQIGAGGAYDMASLESQLGAREKYLADYRTLLGNYNKINQSEVEKIKKILPVGTDIPGLFSQLQALAEANEIILVNISISEAAEAAAAPATSLDEEGAAEPAASAEKPAAANVPAGLKRLNLALSLAGTGNDSYANLKRFLQALENNLRLFDVSAVYFTPDSNGFSVNLITYYTK